MKKILVTTKLKDDTDAGIKKLKDFIKSSKSDCEVLLLDTYMVPRNTPSERLIEENDRIRQTSLKDLTDLKLPLVDAMRGLPVKFSTASRLGTMSSVISQLLRNEKFDLVVLSAKGEKNVEELSDVLDDHKTSSLILCG